MTGARHSNRERAATVPAYYDAMTEQLLKASGELRMIHYGLWGPDTRTETEALMRSVHTMVDGCDLGPGKRVLDAGCGLGGPAVALAREYGVRVTGLTICEPHVELATNYAKERGVGHLVDFRCCNFMDIPFPDGTFDVVTNHETFCYAVDKLAYLKGVLRALKPGGRWRLIDGLLSGMPMSEAQEALHASVQRGAHMQPLVSLEDLMSMLGDAGFEDRVERDLDAEVIPATESLSKRWKLVVLLTPPPRPEEMAYRELMQFNIGFDQGMKEGIFTYRVVSGTKPGRQGPEGG